MILYLETSNLIKIYVKETYSEDIKKSIADTDVVATSIVSYAEARAAFARKFREKGLRVTDEAAFFLKHNKVRELLRLEYSSHRVLKTQVEAICAYSIDTIVNAGCIDVIMPLVRAHAWAIFTGPGGSTVFEPENVEDSDVEKLLQIKI